MTLLGEYADLCREFAVVLGRCKIELLEAFEVDGWDPSMFDVEIELSICVDDLRVEVAEKWKAVEP